MPGPYIPGQVYIGQKVETAPETFSQTITTLNGITAGGSSPTVALLPGAGTVGSITGQAGYDQSGSFVLHAGTASILGGSLCSVTFGTPLAATPSAVIVTAGYTTGTVSYAAGAVSVSKSGFVVQGAAPTSGAAYLINYNVVR